MAKSWLRRLSDVREVARELFRLVGAESDELRGGMAGRSVGRLRRLLEVREFARELFRLVGAESDERRGGMTGRPVEQTLESVSRDRVDVESETVRFFCPWISVRPVDAVGGRRPDR
jgi:hypothetical protein